MLPRKAAGRVEGVGTVPETDSGGQVENTEAFERTQVKELGKLTPKLRDKVCHRTVKGPRPEQVMVATKRR